MSLHEAAVIDNTVANEGRCSPLVSEEEPSVKVFSAIQFLEMVLITQTKLTFSQDYLRLIQKCYKTRILFGQHGFKNVHPSFSF